MKKLRVMDSSGDSVLEFNEAEVDAKATQEAKELFDRLKNQGAAIFAVNRDGQPDRRVTNFDELEASNVVVPRIVGG